MKQVSGWRRTVRWNTPTLDTSDLCPVAIWPLSFTNDLPALLEKLHTLFKILDQYSFRWLRPNIFIPLTLSSCLPPDRPPLLERLQINVPHSCTFHRDNVVRLFIVKLTNSRR